MLINLTNHPSENWSEEQLAEAHRYGSIVDVPFPNIEPTFSSSVVNRLAENVVNYVMALGRNITVHVMGEMTFTYAVVSRLKELGIRCVASTTERTVKEEGGKKISEFKFVQFRDY